MTQEFTSIKYYEKEYTATTWSDVTAYILDNPRPRGQMGIQGNGLMDRVAGGGRMTIAYKYDAPFNFEGMFKMETTWDGVTTVAFLGYYEPGAKRIKPFLGSRYFEVTFRDWMAWAIEYELEVLEYAANQTMQNAIETMLSNMPMNPKFRRYEYITYTFPDVFDTTGSGTTFGGECTKLANSEFGYVYQRYRADGEELVVQGRTARAIGRGYGALTSLPKYSGDQSGDAWQLEASTDQWLTEDGSLWLLEENSTITLTDDDLLVSGQNDFVRDAHAVNFAKISVRPRSYAAVGVLWSMESPQLVAAGETLEDVVGRYRDTSGGASYVNGINMVQPVRTTDFRAFANSDGTGTEYTSSMVVTADFSKTAEAKFTIQNTGATDFYIGGPDIVFQVRGEAVKIYDAITVTKDLSTAVYNDLPEIYTGKHILNFDMYYQDNINEVTGFLDAFVYWKGLTRTNPMSLTFNVNHNTTTMRIWQYGGVGMALLANLDDLIGISFNQNIYINGYSFEVIEGKYINMTIVPFEEKRAVITDI